MTVQRIPSSLRTLVARRAKDCCEYRRLPDSAVFVPHEPDHIIAEQHGGETTSENLAFACWRCNRYKGTNLASVDPKTGQRQFLFDPRHAEWPEHFLLDGAKIVRLTPAGRATVSLLRFNAADRLELRERLIAEGRYPL